VTAYPASQLCLHLTSVPHWQVTFSSCRGLPACTRNTCNLKTTNFRAAAHADSHVHLQQSPTITESVNCVPFLFPTTTC
jgi:hypothetical protein